MLALEEFQRKQRSISVHININTPVFLNTLQFEEKKMEICIPFAYIYIVYESTVDKFGGTR